MVMFRMPGELPAGDTRRCGACSASTETAHGERVVFCTMLQVCVHKRGQCTGFVERKRVEDEAAAKADRLRDLGSWLIREGRRIGREYTASGAPRKR